MHVSQHRSRDSRVAERSVENTALSPGTYGHGRLLRRKIANEVMSVQDEDVDAKGLLMHAARTCRDGYTVEALMWPVVPAAALGKQSNENASMDAE